MQRAVIAATSVARSVANIRQLLDTSPLALRLSSQLLLGTARIHAEQVGRGVEGLGGAGGVCVCLSTEPCRGVNERSM